MSAAWGALAVVAALIVSFSGYLLGVMIGRAQGALCECCGFETDCRFCIRAKCPKARHKTDWELFP